MYCCALFLPSVLMHLCPRDDTALFSVVIRPCPRDDKPLSSGGRVKGFPKSRKKLCWRAVKVVGVILKSEDTDVGRWRWVEKGVSRFCHTPSALWARPPVSRGQSGWPVSFIAAAVEIGLPPLLLLLQHVHHAQHLVAKLGCKGEVQFLCRFLHALACGVDGLF